MNKHVIYLTKEHELDTPPKGSKSLNTFVFNENGHAVIDSWVKKNVENNDGSFLIIDHHNHLKNALLQVLTQKNYFIESVDFSNLDTSIRINPFELVQSPDELHFLFSNLLYMRWDNTDKDIEAMSNLIDAFATAVYFLFLDKPEKKIVKTVVKMAQSIRALIKTPDGKKPLYVGIFESWNADSNLPKQYYDKFVEKSKEHQEEIAQKVLAFFNGFSEAELDMMSRFDESIAPSFNFKTAYFLNADKEKDDLKVKTTLYLLMTLLKQNNQDAPILAVIDNLNMMTDIIDFPTWLKASTLTNLDFLMVSDDLADFKQDKSKEKFFKTMQTTLTASLLMHKNPIFNKYKENEPTTAEEIEEYQNANCIATVLVPNNKISEEDEVF